MAPSSRSPLSYIDVHQAFELAGNLGELELVFDLPRDAIIWTARANKYRVLLRQRSESLGEDHVSEFDHLMIVSVKDDPLRKRIVHRGFNFKAYGPDGQQLDLTKSSINSPVMVVRPKTGPSGLDELSNFLAEVERDLAAKREKEE